MTRLLLGACAALALGGCISVNANVTADDAAPAAVQNARVRECPAGRTQDNARSGSDSESVGVTSADVALTPLASDPTRALRMRRLTIAPGGVIAWHAHDQVQGMALMISGEMTEFRNTCLDPMVYRAGDIAREDATTAHGWRNQSDEPAVVLVAHVVAR